jgi:hypothetical protein
VAYTIFGGEECLRKKMTRADIVSHSVNVEALNVAMIKSPGKSTRIPCQKLAHFNNINPTNAKDGSVFISLPTKFRFSRTNQTGLNNLARFHASAAV